MKPIDIIIIVLVALFVLGVIVYTIWKKKTDKETGCGCGCGGCKGCSSANECPTVQKAVEEETQADVDKEQKQE